MLHGSQASRPAALQVGTFFKRSLLWIWLVSQVVLFAPFMAGALAEQVAGIWCAPLQCCRGVGSGVRAYISYLIDHIVVGPAETCAGHEVWGRCLRLV